MPRSTRRRAYQCGHRHCRARFHTMQPLERYQRRPTTLALKDWRWYREHGTCPRCRRGVLNDCTRNVRRHQHRERCLDDGCPAGWRPHKRTSPDCMYSEKFYEEGLPPW